MMGAPVAPLFDLARGNIVESTHDGHGAVVDSHGRLLHLLGDPHAVAHMRSDAGLVRALPFFEYGGPEEPEQNMREQALLSVSHEGSEEYVRMAESLQAKAGVLETNLRCGVRMSGVMSEGSPDMGIAFTVSGGDLLFLRINKEPRNRVPPEKTPEIRRQIGASSGADLDTRSDCCPSLPVNNHRGETVGVSGGVFRVGAAG